MSGTNDVQVFKCLNGLVPRMFKDDFTKILPSKETRGNNTNLVYRKFELKLAEKHLLFKVLLSITSIILLIYFIYVTCNFLTFISNSYYFCILS